MKTIVVVILVLSALFAGWWQWRAPPMDPLAYRPPAAPGLVAAFAVNNRLRDAQRLGDGFIDGGEDVAVDAQGRVYAGTADGRILRLNADVDSDPELFADTGGRPLGMHFDAEGTLWVADAWQGLLSVGPGGEVQVRVSEVDGVPLRFSNDLDIAADGRIYFSDSSSFSQPQYMLDAFEARPHGRLIRYDPATDQATVLLDGLYFANGVALSRDEDFVLVNETWRYRTIRLWLSGPRAGQHDVFIDNLPGFPDGIATDEQGDFWLALPTLRNAVLDRIHPYPWLKSLIARLPAGWQPLPERYGLVARLDQQGRVLESLHDPGGEQVFEITSVQPVGGTLYLGTLHNQWIARLPIGTPQDGQQ